MATRPRQHPARAGLSTGEHNGAVTIAPADPATPTEHDLGTVRARLRAFIARRVESAEVAEDLTQDVLLRVWATDHGGREKPSTWLYRVARNAIIDHYRMRTSRSRACCDAAATPDPADDPFAEDPVAAERELASCLRSLVDQLEEPYRSAVAGADLEGTSQIGLARAAGVSVSGMKSRVQRGRRQLRHLLTECCPVQTSPSGSISGYEPSIRCQQAAEGGAHACCCAPAANA